MSVAGDLAFSDAVECEAGVDPFQALLRTASADALCQGAEPTEAGAIRLRTTS